MNALIATALKHRLLMVGLFVLTIIGGLIAFQQLNIEAYPDPTPPMVTIITQGQGLSAEEIERYVTIPIEKQVAGIKNLRNIRTISLYSLSSVNLQFTFDYTYEEALQQVLNRLGSLPPLPNNARPEISPISPIGEIFRYKLAGPPDYSVLDLKTLQDWVLERRFRMVPGVIDVVGWGGKTKTFELQVNFSKLVAYGLTLPQLHSDAQQQQRQCRRQHGQYRGAIGGRAGGRPDPVAGRSRQHHDHTERRKLGARARRRDRHDRARAAPRHRRQGR